MLMGGSVVTSCSLHVLLATCGISPGLFARERAAKTDNFYCTYVRTKIGLIQRNPGNRLIHFHLKNFESTPREVQCSDRTQSSTTGSGRSSCVDVLSVLAKNTRTKRYNPKQTKNSQTYVYIFKQFVNI